MNLVLKNVLRSVANPFFPFLKRVKAYGKPKIFGVGANKTGTTSLAYAMIELGFAVGNQRTGENLVDDWAKRDFRRIIKYCKTAQFFQDAPFSYDFTYIALDYVFKESKFILTVRDTPEQWYNSLIRFHGTIWGKNGRVPTKENLMEATYIYKGRPWHTNRLKYTTPEDDPYNKDLMIKGYETHNEEIKNYFRHRPDDLLVLNVSDENAYEDLCKFLNVKKKRDTFPWKNKTSVIK
jgi:hypothetical protein